MKFRRRGIKKIRKTRWLILSLQHKSATKQFQNAANVGAQVRNALGTEIPQASSFATRAARSSTVPVQRSPRGRRRPPHQIASQWSALPHYRYRTNNPTPPRRSNNKASPHQCNNRLSPHQPNTKIPPMSSTRPCWT